MNDFNSIFKKVLIILAIPLVVVMSLVVINNNITPENKTPVVVEQQPTPEQTKAMAAAVEGAAKAAILAAQYAKMEDICRQVIANGIHDDMCFLVDKLGAEKAVDFVTNGQLNKN